MTTRALLVCGVLASLVYLVADGLGGLVWHGYSYASQSISELEAIDAPSRFAVMPLFILYDLLLLAFAYGVWQAAGQSLWLRLTAGLLAAIGVIGLVWTPFAPMHLRGVAPTLTDTMHISFAAVTVPCILLAIGFAAAEFGTRFRAYSIATIVVLLICGASAAVGGVNLAANLPTPWLGIAERINVCGFLLWTAVLAQTLRRLAAAAPVRKPYRARLRDAVRAGSR